MGYNDRYDDRYERRRGGRDGYGRGYDRRGGGGYNDFQFQIGDVVIHKATGKKLTVINYGREQLECRMPDLTSTYFYEHELTADTAVNPMV